MGGWGPHNAAGPNYADDELAHERHPSDDVRPGVVVLGHHQLSCAAGHRTASLSAPWCPAGQSDPGATTSGDGSDLPAALRLGCWSHAGVRTLLLSSALEVSAKRHCDLTEACMHAAGSRHASRPGCEADHQPGRRCWPGSSLGTAFAAPARTARRRTCLRKTSSSFHRRRCLALACRGVQRDLSGRGQVYQIPTTHVYLLASQLASRDASEWNSDVFYLNFRKPVCMHGALKPRMEAACDNAGSSTAGAQCQRSSFEFNLARNLRAYSERGPFVRPAPEFSPVVS